MSPRMLLGALMAASLLGGCDAEEDYAVAVEGYVHDETLDRPADGVRVVMARHPAGWFIEPDEVVAEAETDAAGRYRLDHDPLWGSEDYRVEVNFFPFNPDSSSPDLSADRYYVRSGDRVSQVSALYRFATLTVRAETDGPPPVGVTYSINAGNRGGRDGPVTTSVRANAFAQVRLVVDRDGERTVTADSVYCPLGVVTEYVFRY